MADGVLVRLIVISAKLNNPPTKLILLKGEANKIPQKEEAIENQYFTPTPLPFKLIHTFDIMRLDAVQKAIFKQQEVTQQ